MAADSTHVKIMTLGVGFRAHRKHPPFFSPILSASFIDLLHTAAIAFLFEAMEGGRKRNKRSDKCDKLHHDAL